MQTGKWRTLVQRLYLSRRDTAVTMGMKMRPTPRRAKARTWP